MFITESNNVPVAGEYDVIVCGGGVAGVSAALAANRLGKKVLLLEKSFMLGGLATLGHVNLFVSMCNGRGKKIIKGMCEELLNDSIRYGFDTLADEWRDGKEPDYQPKRRYETKFSAFIFALVLMEKLDDCGIKLLFDSVVSMPVMEGGHCKGIIVESKSGRQFYGAKMIVDTTGDADILYRAGMPTETGRNFFTHDVWMTDMEHIKKAAESGNLQDAIYEICGGGASLHGTGHPEGMKTFTGVTAEEITEYIIMNRKIILDKVKKSDRLSREILSMPGMPQFRETRHLVGDSVFAAEKYVHFDDSIAAINDFEYRDYLYEISYGCLVKTGFDNIITAGRSISCSGWGWDVSRVIPPAIITGQAAGIACAHAIDEAKPIYGIDVKKLQEQLAKDDVMIHFDDSLIPEKDKKETDAGSER